MKLTQLLTQFHIQGSDDKERDGFNNPIDQVVARGAGMAELADAADSKTRTSSGIPAGNSFISVTYFE